MRTAEHHGIDLVPFVLMLGAGVIAVALFKRAGLGSVLGYLVAGLLIGPPGLGFFSDPASILHVAELGIVLFLFVIGLEMQPSRLWSLRQEIFGLGALQVVTCSVLLGGVGVLAGFSATTALEIADAADVAEKTFYNHFPTKQHLIEELSTFAAQPKYMYRHVWEPDDVLMWDNRCTVHAVTPHDPTERRVMHRTTIVGREPVTAG